MKAYIHKLSSFQRWLIYLCVGAVPGLIVQVVFGFLWALMFELIVWVPQQRLFDALRLAETLPYQQKR